MTCQRLRDTDVFCEACRALVPESRPLNGWLMLAALNLVIAPVNFVSALGRLWAGLREGSLGLLDGEIAGWLGWSLLETIPAGVLTAIAVMALPRLVGRRRSAVMWMKAFFIGTAVSAVLVRWAFSRLELTVPGTLDWALISSVLWIGYFQTSNSVQQTFVR